VTLPPLVRLSGSGTLGGKGVRSLTGQMEWTAGTVGGPGDFVVGGSGSVIITGSSSIGLWNSRLENHGTITWAGSNTLYRREVAVIDNAGLFLITSDASLSGEGHAKPFNNLPGGILRKQHSGGSTRFSATVFNNSGTVEVLSGTLEVNTFHSAEIYTQTAGRTHLEGGRVRVDRPLRLDGGVLSGSGTIEGNLHNSDGSVQPGSDPDDTGVLTVTGTYTQGSGASVRLKLGGPNAGSGYDRLNANVAVLDGTLELVRVRSFIPGGDDVLYPIRWLSGSRQGTFHTVLGEDFAPGVWLRTDYNPTDLTVYNHTAQGSHVWASVAAPEWARGDQRVPIKITITNTSDFTIVLPFEIVLDPHPLLDLSQWEVPTDPDEIYQDLRRRLGIELPPPDPGEPYPALKRYFEREDGKIVVPMVATIPAGSSVDVSVRTGCGSGVSVNLGKPFDLAQLGSCAGSLSSVLLDFVPGYDCLKFGLSVFNLAAENVTTGTISDAPGKYAGTALGAFQCAFSLFPPTKVIQTVVRLNDAIYRTINLQNAVNDCVPLFHPDGRGASGQAGCAFSYDPNDKIGPEGVTAGRYLTGDDTLRYTVFFENLPAATAAAQEVVVSDTLDVRVLRASTLSFGTITFAETVVDVPENTSEFATDVDLRPAMNLVTRITAGVDSTTGVITWRFVSLDPATMMPTQDPLAGFLPPNRSDPEGQGSVSYRVLARSGLETGTAFGSAARIFFDTNDPIDTPPWVNRIDRSPPESRVAVLDSVQAHHDFTVRWSGEDHGSGIRDFTIYVSRNGAPFEPWLTQTADTSAVFEGEPGTTYAFYALARDFVGFVQEREAVGDASTRTAGGVGMPEDPLPAAFALEQNYPNPFNPVTAIRFAVPEATRLQLAVYDMLGREVAVLLDGPVEAGWHRVAFDAGHLASGVYFYRLTTSTHTQVRSMMLVR
jgi:hypothetical protein